MLNFRINLEKKLDQESLYLLQSSSNNYNFKS